MVCGVSGTGKSTVGKLLAETLRLPFYDGDDFHPASNVNKMQRGIPLDDNDRQPWLQSLSDELAQWEDDGGAVLACSALKESYRTTLASQCKQDVTWIYLHGSTTLLTERLNARQGHFLDSRLLASQLDTLELPDYGWVIDVQSSAAKIVTTISQRLVKTSTM